MDTLADLAAEVALAEYRFDLDSGRIPQGVRGMTPTERDSGVNFAYMDTVETIRTVSAVAALHTLRRRFSDWFVKTHPSRTWLISTASFDQLLDLMAPTITEVELEYEAAATAGWASTMHEAGLDRHDVALLDVFNVRTDAAYVTQQALSVLIKTASDALAAGSDPLTELAVLTLGSVRNTVRADVTRLHRLGRLVAAKQILGEPTETLNLSERINSIVASELLDRNTCRTCKKIDGHPYPSIDAALIDYPRGIYRHCLAGPRCRGCLVITWAGQYGPKPPPLEEYTTAVVTERQRLVGSRKSGVAEGGDDSWSSADEDGWHVLRTGTARVRRVDGRNFELQTLQGDQWVTVMEGIWARIAEQPEVNGLMPPGYSWHFSEEHEVWSFAQPTWDESKHPRHPIGAPASQGGRFAKSPSAGRHEILGITKRSQENAPAAKDWNAQIVARNILKIVGKRLDDWQIARPYANEYFKTIADISSVLPEFQGAIGFQGFEKAILHDIIDDYFIWLDKNKLEGSKSNFWGFLHAQKFANGTFGAVFTNQFGMNDMRVWNEMQRFVTDKFLYDNEAQFSDPASIKRILDAINERGIDAIYGNGDLGDFKYLAFNNLDMLKEKLKNAYIGMTTPNDKGPDAMTYKEAYILAAKLTQAWAESSHSDESVLVQAAVARLFDVSPEPMNNYLKKPWEQVESDYYDGNHFAEWGQAPNNGEVLLTKGRVEAYVRAVYELTQAEFRKRGITHIDLDRGCGLNWNTDTPEGSGIPNSEFPAVFDALADGVVSVSSSPLTAWGADPDTAKGFGQNRNVHGWWTQRFHVSRIFGITKYGPGCHGEHEVVPIGAGDQPWRARYAQMYWYDSKRQMWALDLVRQNDGSMKYYLSLAYMPGIPTFFESGSRKTMDDPLAPQADSFAEIDIKLAKQVMKIAAKSGDMSKIDIKKLSREYQAKRSAAREAKRAAAAAAAIVKEKKQVPTDPEKAKLYAADPYAEFLYKEPTAPIAKLAYKQVHPALMAAMWAVDPQAFGMWPNSSSIVSALGAAQANANDFGYPETIKSVQAYAQFVARAEDQSDLKVILSHQNAQEAYTFMLMVARSGKANEFEEWLGAQQKAGHYNTDAANAILSQIRDQTKGLVDHGTITSTGQVLELFVPASQGNTWDVDILKLDGTVKHFKPLDPQGDSTKKTISVAELTGQPDPTAVDFFGKMVPKAKLLDTINESYAAAKNADDLQKAADIAKYASESPVYEAAAEGWKKAADADQKAADAVKEFTASTPTELKKKWVGDHVLGSSATSDGKWAQAIKVAKGFPSIVSDAPIYLMKYALSGKHSLDANNFTAALSVLTTQQKGLLQTMVDQLGPAGYKAWALTLFEKYGIKPPLTPLKKEEV